MNHSVVSAIEKIKVQEQDNENKLKEQREYEIIVSNLNRAITEAVQGTDKHRVENEQISHKINGLHSELIIEKIKRDALIAQVQACQEELDTLRSKFEHDITKVWELRSSLCTAVQTVADECDIRALLIRPMYPEYIPPPDKKCSQEYDQSSKYEDHLKAAIEMRDGIIRERERLQVEPEVGEEFVRIRNALAYSLDMVSKLKNQNI